MKQNKFFETLRIVLFCVFLVGMCVLGFMITLRPTHSDSENRDLTAFPDFELEAFMDGSYTSEIGLWYSDTFPFREQLIALNTRLRGFYGIKTFTASSDGQGEEIDTGETFVWDTSHLTPPEESEPVDTEPGSDGETETEDFGHEIIKGYLVEENRGYELYYFNRKNSDRYARLVVQTALNVGDRAQVYAMVTPMSYAYGVSPETQVELNVSDCRASIDWMYRAIEQYSMGAGVTFPVITVDAYSALEAHRDEYIFFRTDHHWTALGAYYASRSFLDIVGREYPALHDEAAYTPIDFEGFTGSLAGHTKHETPVLVENPDTIQAFIPTSLNELTITTAKGEILTRPLVNPHAATEFSASQRYRCFIDGDYPFSVAHNPAVDDGSAILLIKESYGNAFLPMLVDSYEYVYAIDYRFYRTMSVSDLVDTYDINTILFVNNPVATSADYNMNCLERFVGLMNQEHETETAP